MLVADPTDHTAGHPEQVHCPPSVSGGTGGWDREADERAFKECGNEGDFQQRGWVMRRVSQGCGVGEGRR